MRTKSALRISPLLIAALALAGCSASSPVEAEGSGSKDAPTTSEKSGGGGESYATITIDGETWEYSSFMCAIGYTETDSDEYSFSGTSFTTSDDEKVQFLLDVTDQSGQDRTSGDGVSYEIDIADYGNIDNPSIELNVVTETGVTISGKSVTISGEFDAISGTTHTIEADAVCQ